MGTITVRNVDDAIKQALRLKAARRGVSLEEEVRLILRREAGPTEKRRFDNLYDAIRELVEPHGGFEFEIPDRSLAERDPPFKDWT